MNFLNYIGFRRRQGADVAPKLDPVAAEPVDRAAAALLQRVGKWSTHPPSNSEFIGSLREFAALNNRITRSYDAAMTDNLNLDFRGTFGSANTEMLPALYMSRARGRTLTKDDPHGKAVNRIYADNVIGDDPFELEMRVGKKDVDGNFVKEKNLCDAIELWWKEFGWSENLTVKKDMSFMEAGRVIEMARVHPGTAIMRLHPGYEFNKFRFAVELLEADRLQETYQAFSPANGLFGANNPIIASVERHPKYKFALAYWILTRHPGEFLATPAPYTIATKVLREQVPADRIILFSNLRERPEQDLGMTELDSTMMPIWRNRQYSKSLTIAAIAGCIRAFVLEKKFPTGIEIPHDMQEAISNFFLNVPANVGGSGMAATGASGEAAAQQGAVRPVQNLSLGMREELPYGVESKILQSEFPQEAGHDFRNDNLREISTGTVRSYQELSGDYQNLGFIAGLMSQQAFHRWMRIRQNSLKDPFRVLFREALRATIRTDYFDRLGVDVSITRLDEFALGARFKGQQWEFVNPLVQAQSLILLEEAGHMSKQGVQDQLPQGKEFDELTQERKQEREELEKAGLSGMDEIATEPNINKEGDYPPGSERPVPSNLQEGGAADIPPKSRPANPLNKTKRDALAGDFPTAGALIKPQFGGAKKTGPASPSYAEAGAVYLGRHGATDFNGDPTTSDDRVRGHQDVPLNDKGRKDAHKMADELQDAALDRIFSSDLSRSRETAEIIGDRVESPLRSYYDLRPWAMGPDIEGKPSRDVQDKIASLATHPDEKPDGGESFNEFKSRFFNRMDSILAANQSRNILLVVHYRNIKLIEARKSGADVDVKKFLELDTASSPGSLHNLVDGKLEKFSVPEPEPEKPLRQLPRFTRRRRGEIDPTTLSLINTSNNGQ